MNIARVQRAHGKEGEVLVRPVRGLPLLLTPGITVALTPPALDRDRFTRVESVTDRGDDVLVRFEGIDGIDLAESVEGCYVLARRDALDLSPLMAPVSALLGRAVVDGRYGVLGTIQEVMETPANDVWVIDGGPYGEVLVPVIEQVVPCIPENGEVAVTLPDGLIEATVSASAQEAGEGAR